MRILMVEDDAAFARATRVQLEEQGFEVDICGNGSEAMFYVKQQSYHIILLDYLLPVLDGMEFLQIIRGQGLATPVIMLTGIGGLDDKICGLDLGADDYLVKPFAFGGVLDAPDSGACFTVTLPLRSPGGAGRFSISRTSAPPNRRSRPPQRG